MSTEDSLVIPAAEGHAHTAQADQLAAESNLAVGYTGSLHRMMREKRTTSLGLCLPTGASSTRTEAAAVVLRSRWLIENSIRKGY